MNEWMEQVQVEYRLSGKQRILRKRKRPRLKRQPLTL
jgi:hypothetical protein